MKAKAMLELAGIQYKSRSEEDWAKIGAAMIKDHAQTGVELWMYEPMAFKIPGGRYTPDFCYWLESGEQVFVEVKGSKRQRNYRDARSKLRAAAEVYPFYHWFMAIGKGLNWTLERI